jgi:hypothetical protein
MFRIFAIAIVTLVLTASAVPLIAVTATTAHAGCGGGYC